jgi:hypothetical protein
VFQGKRYLKTMQEEQQQPNFALLHLKLFSGLFTSYLIASYPGEVLFVLQLLIHFHRER